MSQPAANAPSRVRLPAWGTEGKLDGTNYTLWQFKMKANLIAYELWDTVLGIDQNLVDPNDPNIIFQPNPASGYKGMLMLCVKLSLVSKIQC